MLHLIHSNQIPEKAVTGTYDFFYVFLSYVVSVIAAWIAILILEDISRAHQKMRIKGCILGAIVMGGGIWSMHFLGMLAYKMGMEHSYTIGVTFISMVIASLFSFAVFYNITREKLSLKDILIDAPLMGIGVASMHYIGMAAMDMRADIFYISSLFWASIFIAIIASGAAMFIMRFVNASVHHKRVLSFAAALIMGLAVCAMHYTGMEATVMVPFPDCRFVKDQNTTLLFTAIVLISLSISMVGIYLVSKGFLNEKSAQKSLYSHQGVIISNAVIAILAGIIFCFVHYESNKVELNTLESFKKQEELRLDNVSKSIENVMARIHSKLSVLSSLHFVKNEIEKSSTFTKDTAESIKQVAKSLMDISIDDSMSVKFVRFYALNHDADVAKNISIVESFDIKKENNNQKDTWIKKNEHDIENIIKNQATWFSQKYPSLEFFKNGATPSRIDWVDASSPKNQVKDKNGDYFPIIYSMPIYNNSGVFIGVVSCAFTTILFESILAPLEGSLLIMRGEKENNIYPINPPGHLRGSTSWIKKNEPDPALLYSTTYPLIIQDSSHSWNIWMGSDESKYYESNAFNNSKNFRILGYSVVFILTILALILFNSMRQSYKQKFEKEAEANKSKSEFLSNMSHELRTPMHAILSYASMGLDKIDNERDPSLKKYFGNIQTAGTRLLSLLNNLLDLAKIESGKMEFHFKDNDFRVVVDHTLVELQSLLSKKGINVDVAYDSATQTSVFDREKMVQVLVNLMSNSIKFSPESSTICIKVEDAPLLHTKEKGLMCSIMDQGVGIPPDEVESVFDKFIQSSKTKTQAGGTGLGLSICKQIIEAHGGSIWAKNGEESGAIFQFQFPIERSEDN